MPKKLVSNPEYRDAPYALGFRFHDGRPAPEDLVEQRFLKPFPATVKTTDELAAWVAQHSISTHIKVEE